MERPDFADAEFADSDTEVDDTEMDVLPEKIEEQVPLTAEVWTYPVAPWADGLHCRCVESFLIRFAISIPLLRQVVDNLLLPQMLPFIRSLPWKCFSTLLCAFK